MNRRAFLMAAGLGSLASYFDQGALRAAAQTADAGGADFSWDILKGKAKALAASPYLAPGADMPEALKSLDYDQFRAIEFRPDRAIWAGTELPYQMQLFHSGYLYREPVEIFILDNGRAAPIRYEKSLFHFGPAEKRVPLPEEAGFSGLRLHAEINDPGIFEEFLVFQGASYFRGKAKGQTYGLSARGLALNTAQAVGEEFPIFRSYWVEAPAPGQNTVTVYALLDSGSTTGAYRFTVNTSVDVVMEVECELFPRKPLDHAGIAPFSSMFFYGPADHTHHGDFRPRVHDSDGLLMLTGRKEWIWRPLVTARHILYSAFVDASPAGFGLMQRLRGFENYQDIYAEYEKRPSAWIEPLSDWGEGSVDLIELPTGDEYQDNIVVFWRPKEPMQPGNSYAYRYRLSWCWHVPVSHHIGSVLHTFSGVGIAPGSRYLAIDFAGGDLYADADEEHWDYDVGASQGQIRAFTVTPNRYINGKRIGIEYHPDGNKDADLFFQILKFGRPLTEKWIYRWAHS